ASRSVSTNPRHPRLCCPRRTERPSKAGTSRMAVSSIPTLSAHGAKIPVIGYGTSGMGDVRPEHVATALKLGYRHIDTAWKYGTERAVGEGMRASGVPRADIFLCTKVPHESRRAAASARGVEGSLKPRGVD